MPVATKQGGRLVTYNKESQTFDHVVLLGHVKN